MAAKKKVAKKKVAKKSAGKGLAATSKNTQIADFRDRLKTMAKKDSARGHKMGDSNFISTQGGIFTFQGNELPNPFLGIIVDFTYENAYYDSAWNPDAPQPPACYAIGEDPNELVPADNSSDIQADNCAECEMNVFGTSNTGSGKACKNGVRLSIVNASDMNGELNLDGVHAMSEPAFLRLAPTSLKHFEKYKDKFTRVYGMPLLGTVTEFELQPNKTWFEVHFTNDELIEDDQMLQNMLAVSDANEDILREGFDPSNYDADKPSPRRGKKVAKKKVAKKKSARAAKY